MKRLVEEILQDMETTSYVPNEADALILIAWGIKQLGELLAKSTDKAIEF